MRFVTTTALSLLCLVAMAVRVIGAEAKFPAYTDPENAGIDYKLQGEYVGELKSDQSNRKIAVQVVALGDRKFRAVAYLDGLPGDGWSRGDEKHSGEGELNNGPDLPPGMEPVFKLELAVPTDQPCSLAEA